jgi:hypothetical protein
MYVLEDPDETLAVGVWMHESSWHWLQWVRPLLPGPNPFIARALTADTF